MNSTVTSKERASWGEMQVLELLAGHSYDEVRALTGWSRGRIYSAALRNGARKTEARIAARRAERRSLQQELLMEVLNSTVKADVLEFLAGMPDESVSAMVSSPPYNLGKRYAGSEGAESGSMDAWRFTYYHGWLAMVLSEAERILQPGGTLCLQVGQTRDWTGSLYPMDVMLFEDLRRSGLQYQSRIIWTFGHGLTPKRRLAERYETMLVFSKGEQRVFNANAARVPQKDPGKRAFKGPHKGALSGHPLGAAPTNVWTIPQVGHNHPEKEDHPCQFPVELARRAILLYTMAGELVMDPFSGSGSTQEAALRTGRAFVGADLFYEDVRAKRLAKVAPDLVTMLPGVSDESVAVWQAEARRVDRPAVAVADQKELELF